MGAYSAVRLWIYRISMHNAHKTLIELNQFHTKISHLQRTPLANEIIFLKKKSYTIHDIRIATTIQNIT